MLTEVIACSWSVRVTYSELMFFKCLSRPLGKKNPRCWTHARGLELGGRCGWWGEPARSEKYQADSLIRVFILRGKGQNPCEAAGWNLNSLVPAPETWLGEWDAVKTPRELKPFPSALAYSVSQGRVGKLYSESCRRDDFLVWCSVPTTLARHSEGHSLPLQIAGSLDFWRGITE